MQSTARLIITEKCSRSCSYCVNRQPGILDNAVELHDFSRLKGYDNLCITGGEPMLEPELALGLARAAKIMLSPMKVYLYTSYFDKLDDLTATLNWCDGLTFTLHEGTNEEDLRRYKLVQAYIRTAAWLESKRLKIHWAVPPVNTVGWNRIDTLVPKPDCGIAPGERLFIWRPDNG